MSSTATTMSMRAPSHASSAGAGSVRPPSRWGEALLGAPTTHRRLRVNCRSLPLQRGRGRQRTAPGFSLPSSSSSERGPGPARSILDAEGIPWSTDPSTDAADVSAKAPRGLNMNEGLPGDSLPALAARLNAAVVQSVKDGLYDECVVDVTPFGVEECYGDVANAVAEVVVAATAAETAGRFNMALRRRELRRLREAVWDLRVILETRTKESGTGATLTVRHRLEELRSAALDVCHPAQRAPDAPSASAIPNFQVVHQDFSLDAVPDLFDSQDDDASESICRAGGADVAFYRGGQPTAEGRAWLVSRGFKTVVDLRLEDRNNQWTRPLGGGYGAGHTAPERQLDVVHIPVTDMEPPSFEAVEQFIEIANDESRRPMYVHCKAGIGRTGSMVSCWRISQGMDVEDALDLESLCCDFGSIAQEAFVRSFAERLAAKRREKDGMSSSDDGAKVGASKRQTRNERRNKESIVASAAAATTVYSAGRGTEPVVVAETAEASVTAAAVAEESNPPKSSEADATAPDGTESIQLDAIPPSPTSYIPPVESGSFYEGAGFHEHDMTLFPTDRMSSLLESPDGTGSGILRGKETVTAVGEHSTLDMAPDMYIIRTDGFTCTREEVEERMLKISHPSTQQLVLVWREPPKRILILKKLGMALLPQLVEVAHAMMSMGFQVVVETTVLDEMHATAHEHQQKNGSAEADGSGRTKEDEIRDAVVSRVGSLDLDESTGRIPQEDWGTIDVIVCLGGDGVILHASKLFQGPVPPLLGFHFGSMGFLTNHPPESMAQSLLQGVGKGKPVHNIKGGVPITLRMRLECTVVKRRESIRNGGDGKPSHNYTVLNEVLVDRGPSPFLSKIEAYDRGQLITTIQADGVMLATATGSTAYSVSAGGSMVHPNVPAILMTPICPHTLSFRPVVFPDSVEVELRVADDARCSAWVSFDGKERCELCSGDSVFIRMSQFPVPTVNYADQTGDFISSLRRCLRWNERDEQKPLDERTMKELRRIGGSVD